LFFEDLQELVKTIDMRGFLQLLDGFQKRDGILTIVTGNDFSDLEANLKSRPRRFDRFFEFPLPNLELCKKYLTKYFGVILTSKKIESIAKKAVKKKLSYAHLQEVYFNAVFIAIPEGRETPNANDVDLSLQQVIQEKALAESDFLSKKRDLTDEEDIDEEEGDCL
jgi:ATP-dependent 26S proteasome regulatory subunit